MVVKMTLMIATRSVLASRQNAFQHGSSAS
jgi:hypothetical protein